MNFSLDDAEGCSVARFQNIATSNMQRQDVPEVCPTSGDKKSPSADATDYIRMGDNILEKGASFYAALFFKRALLDDPENAEAWTKLGQIEIKNKNFVAAERCFNQAWGINVREEYDASLLRRLHTLSKS